MNLLSENTVTDPNAQADSVVTTSDKMKWFGVVTTSDKMKWFGMLSRHEVKSLFERVCASGNVQDVAKFVDHFQITSVEVSGNRALSNAVASGSIPAVRFLVSKFRLFGLSIGLFLPYAAANGDIFMMLWLMDNLSYEPEKDRHRVQFALRLACEKGKMEAVKWLVEHFELTREEVAFDNNVAFLVAAREGHCDVLSWFAEHCQLTREDALDFMRNPLVKERPASTEQWMKDRFAIAC